MSLEQDRVFFRNFSLIVGAIAVMMVLFFVAAHFVVPDEMAYSADAEAAVSENTAPVGKVVVEGEEPAEAAAAAPEQMAADMEAASAVDDAAVASSEPRSGEDVYNGICKNCHGMAAMAAMIPQTGDAAAWEARIAKGVDTLYQHAINGFVGELGMMPAKGGNPSLGDDEVKAAVDYMVQALP